MFGVVLNTNIYAESKVLPPVIDNSIYPGASGGSFGSVQPSTNALYDVLGQLEQLQLEVQQLRGIVEEQSQEINKLKKDQKNTYSDLDVRLQELNGGQEQVVIDSTATNPTYSSSPQSGQSDDPSITITEPNSIEVGTAGKPSISDKQRYHSAYEMLRNGHNSKAIIAFEALINDSPSSEYADNSQYWLGEAYKVSRNFDNAKAAFLKVVNEYIGSPKVPDALLKLGYIEYEQNNMAKARDYLTQITVDYPETTAAHLANKKLQQLINK